MKLRHAVRVGLQKLGYDVIPVGTMTYPDPRFFLPLDTTHIEVLHDADFRHSCAQVKGHTVLDVPRLANLWTLCRMANPAGTILEVGSYRGGGALHLANSAPGRRVAACDPFQGFDELHPTLDDIFDAEMFKDVSKEAVEQLFREHGHEVRVVAGYFPESWNEPDLEPFSFVHLDVDTYAATTASLEFLATRMTERSVIVADDFQREAGGVDKAIGQFVAAHRDWAAFPLFPSQALLVHRSWFGG